MKPTAGRSRISSSYLSDSSGFGEESRARTALYNPERGCAGSTSKGCISETTLVAPMGSADVGAIFSVNNQPNINHWLLGLVPDNLTFSDSVYRQIVKPYNRGYGREVKGLVRRLLSALEVCIGR